MSQDKPWQDEETLRRLYIEEGMTQPEIADEFGCGQSTVSNWLQKFDVKTRSRSDWKTKYPKLHNESWLKVEYQKKERTAPDIADELGCSDSAVLCAVEKAGIPKHSQGISKKTIHPSFDYRRGYMRATSHNYDDGVQTGTDTIRVHRLVAVAEYGLNEIDGKHVHHKNGIPWDNRPGNLEPLTPSEHHRLHNYRPEDVWDRDPYPSD